MSVLTERGHAQAHAAGAALASASDLSSNIKRVYVSSLTRARQTLDDIATTPGLVLPEARVLAELREIDLGSWEGRKKGELQAAFAGEYAHWKDAPLAFTVDGTRPVVDL